MQVVGTSSLAAWDRDVREFPWKWVVGTWFDVCVPVCCSGHRVGIGCPAAMIANLFVHLTHVNSGGRDTTGVDVHCSVDSNAGPWGCMPPCWLWTRVVAMWSPQCLVCKTFWLRVRRFLIRMFVLFRSEEYVNRFVSLLILPALEVLVKHHDCQIFGRHAWILEEGNRPALLHTCVGDSRFGACECVPPGWLLFWGVALSLHSSRLGNYFAWYRFVFRVFVDFRSGQYVIRCVCCCQSVLLHRSSLGRPPWLGTCPSDPQKCGESSDRRCSCHE